MTAIVVPIAFFLSLVILVIGVAQIVSDGRTRRRLIESNASPEMVQAILLAPGDFGLHMALQWGLVAIGVGLALIVVQFLPFPADGPIAFGIVVLGAGAGLLGYYAVGRRMAARTARPAGA